jgi:serine phosphatase RsbU (regulator of sigma subunit)
MTDVPVAGVPIEVEPPAVVLLIEDDEGDALLVDALLEDADAPFVLERARTLGEARPLVRRAGCVLLDLDLPDATGLDGLRELRALAPRAPVVVLTGRSDRSQGLQAVAAGAQDYLLKSELEGPLLVRSVGYAIERSRADAAARELARSELLRAENIRLERGLLPRPLLDDPKLTWVSRYRPGGGRLLLGGDFFDAVEEGDGTVRLIVGDVCGHGPDEAALGVALRIAWRTLVLAGVDDDDVLPALERVLVTERDHDARFTSVATVVLAADRASAEVRLAGHPAPIVLGRGQSPVLLDEARGPLLGVVPGARWPVHRVGLTEGWAMLLYTDGLYEGRVGDGSERLGLDGLLDLLERRTFSADTTAFVDGLIGAVEALNGGPLADDIAVFLLSPPGEGTDAPA